MIELTLPCEFHGARREPFVVKAHAASSVRPPALTSAHHAPIVPNVDKCMLATAYGLAIISGVVGDTIDRDVFYIDPTAGRAHRWLRARSNQNTLLVTERCDQLCVMCSQPPRKTHIDLFPALREACLLAEEGAVIGISGGEPTLYKAQLFELIQAVIGARPDLSFHVLTNAQHFSNQDITQLRALAPYVWWGVPVYSADPVHHDAIVGKTGAFEALMRGLGVLSQSGSIIELRTVVMRETVQGLSTLADWVVARLPGIEVWAIMQLERQGFARARWSEQFFDHSTDFRAVGDAASYAAAWGIRVRLYNFPHCTIPHEFRSLAPATISDWKQVYLQPCETCPQQQLCGGLFSWHNTTPYERWGTL